MGKHLLPDELRIIAAGLVVLAVLGWAPTSLALSTGSSCLLQSQVAEVHTAGKKKQKRKKKKKKRKAPAYKYEVKPGDTLGAVSQRFGVTVSEIRRWNNLKNDVIYVGRTLKVYPRKPVRITREVEVAVKPGDTLGKIAKQHDVTVKELMKWNRLRSPRSLKAGQKLKIKTVGPENPSEAKGRPQSGRLINGEQMPLEHSCYVLKRRRNAWGTNETVEQLLEAVQTVCSSSSLKRKSGRKKIPAVVIGDLSAKKGGSLPPHKSHQNGRDADLGYYHKGDKKLKEFKTATRKNIDLPLTWALLNQMIKQDAVEYIFVDRKIQKWLYAWALKKGEKKNRLRRIFQYPAGKGSPLIRHEPGHMNHFHVRFRCPSTDENCY